MGVGKQDKIKNQFIDNKVGRSDAAPSLSLVRALNPFEVDLEILGVRREVGYYRDSNGDYHKNTFISEKNEKVSFYISVSNKDVLMKLGCSGMRLFLWICSTIKRKEDRYWLNVPKFMREADITINTVKSGIKELIDSNIIALTDVKGVYFINPNFIFRGNRVDNYEDLVKVVDSRIKLEKNK